MKDTPNREARLLTANYITKGDIVVEHVSAFDLDPTFHPLRTCFQLRYAYYVQKRQWVSAAHCHECQEIDGYDARALHLAVLTNDDIDAYVRVLAHDPDEGFMLDREFCELLTEDERRDLPREGSVELSRLVCRESILTESLYGEKSQPHPIELLLKLLYHISQDSGFSRFYIVVEERWLRPFARRFGLRFQVIGRPFTFPDGTRTVAATATLEQLEAAMLCRNPAKHAWYSEVR